MRYQVIFVFKQRESKGELLVPSKSIRVRNWLKLAWFCKWFLLCNLLSFSPVLISAAISGIVHGVRQDFASRKANLPIQARKSPFSWGVTGAPWTALSSSLAWRSQNVKRHPNTSQHVEQVLTAQYWSRRWHQDQEHPLQQNYCSQCQPGYLTAKTEERGGGFHIQLNKQTNHYSFCLNYLHFWNEVESCPQK